MTNRLLVLDTETGGLDPNQYSILSIGAVVWGDGMLLDEIELPIAEETIITDPQSLAINHIDPKAHLATAIPSAQAIITFVGYLEKNFPTLKNGDKITLVGHNIAFDVGFLRRFFKIGNCRFDAYFSHRTVDTATILKFLMMAGLLNMKSPNSSEAFAHFGIEIDHKERHTALADAKATAKLFSAMLALVQSR